MITSLKGSELSAVGAKRYTENTSNLYSGLTIQSRPCWPKAGVGLINLNIAKGTTDPRVEFILPK